MGFEVIIETHSPFEFFCLQHEPGGLYIIVKRSGVEAVVVAGAGAGARCDVVSSSLLGDGSGCGS